MRQLLVFKDTTLASPRRLDSAMSRTVSSLSWPSNVLHLFHALLHPGNPAYYILTLIFTSVTRSPKRSLSAHRGPRTSLFVTFNRPKLPDNQSCVQQTLSIHHASPGFFPSSPLSQLPASPPVDPFTLSLPLKSGASSATLLRIWPLVEAVKDAFHPDYTVVQCGTDGLAGDPCATFNYSLGTLGECVRQVLHTWPGRKLLLGGGGYHSANAARAWASFTAIAVCFFFLVSVCRTLLKHVVVERGGSTGYAYPGS